jgi:hypothetical protein
MILYRLADRRSDGHHRLSGRDFALESEGRMDGLERRANCKPGESERRGGRAGTLALLALIAAAEPADAIVSARLLAPIAADAAIAIEMLDDSDDNLKLRDAIAVGLAAEHRTVAADAALVLRVRAEILADGRRAGPGTRGPRPGRGTGRPLRGGLANADHDPTIEGEGRARANPSGEVRHRLRATLERRDGTVLWQGEATGVLVGNAEAALWAELASRVVGAFGRTVDSRPRAAP